MGHCSRWSPSQVTVSPLIDITFFGSCLVSAFLPLFGQLLSSVCMPDRKVNTKYDTPKHCHLTCLLLEGTTEELAIPAVDSLYCVHYQANTFTPTLFSLHTLANMQILLLLLLRWESFRPLDERASEYTKYMGSQLIRRHAKRRLTVRVIVTMQCGDGDCRTFNLPSAVQWMAIEWESGKVCKKVWRVKKVFFLLYHLFVTNHWFVS